MRRLFRALVAITGAYDLEPYTTPVHPMRRERQIQGWFR